MLRIVGIVMLVAVLALFIYQPANHPAEHFAQLQLSEARAIAEVFGERHAAGVIKRSESLLAQSRRSPLPGDYALPPTDDEEMTRRPGGAAQTVPARLANNEYARSMESMFDLFLFRCAALVQYLPLLVPLFLVLLADGLTEREIRSSEFSFHSPVIYGLFRSLALLLLLLVPGLFAMPFALDPIVVATVPVFFALFCALAVSHFHRTTA